MNRVEILSSEFRAF